MTQPPKYPRIPYLWPPEGGADNVIPSGEVEGWLEARVTVEEKLDGANVALWADGTRVLSATRGGLNSRDRSGQRGRLRAWVAERHSILLSALAPDRVIYGEWLWLTHTVHYDRLPGWLVLLDIWAPEDGWANDEARRRSATAAGLTVPPVLFSGRLRSRDSLISLLGRSAYGSDMMEGAVIRADDGRRCKVVQSGLRRVDDSAFAAGRPVNSVA